MSSPPISWSRSVGAAVTINVFSAIPFFLTGTLAVRLRADLGISEAGLGGLFAMLAVGATVTAPMTGLLAERVGPGASLRGAAVLSSSVLLLIPLLADGWFSYAAFMLVAGVVATGVQSASNLWLLRTLGGRRLGLAFGFKQAGGPAAALLAGLSVPLLAAAVGWRWTFAIFGAVSLLAVPAVPRAGQPDHRRSARGREGDAAVGPLIAIALGFAVSTAVSSSFVGFAVTAAVDQAGMNESSAGVLFAVGAVCGVLARVAIGAAADRGWGSPFALSSLMVAMGSVGFLLLSTGSTLAFVTAVPFSFVTAWGWSGVLHQAVTEANPVAPATATGIIQTGGSVGLFVGPLVFGLLAGRSYSAAWLVTSCASVAGSACLLLGWYLTRRAVHEVVV